MEAYIEKARQVAYHVGILGCHKPFIYFTKELEHADAITEDVVIWGDGHKAYAGETLKCGSCGGRVNAGLINCFELRRLD